MQDSIQRRRRVSGQTVKKATFKVGSRAAFKEGRIQNVIMQEDSIKRGQHAKRAACQWADCKDSSIQSRQYLKMAECKGVIMQEESMHRRQHASGQTSKNASCSLMANKWHNDI